MNEIEIEKTISNLLDNFFKRRIDRISTLKLRDALARKNPYLYKVLGVDTASDIVKEILNAYMSSSDEGIFGDTFFEELAMAVSGGTMGGKGIDIVLESDVVKVIAVKSGTNIFNSSSRDRQKQYFNEYRKIASNKKPRKFVDAVVGYGYGRKQTEMNSDGFREIAGQAFWEEMTGDPEFYIKIINFINNKPQKYLPEYQLAFENAVAKFTEEFKNDFCFPDGSINWAKLVQFNSGKPFKKLNVLPKSTKTLDIGETFQIQVEVTYYNDVSEIITGLPDITYEVTDKDILDISENGIVCFKEGNAPGSEVKVTISCYGRSITRKFKLKKPKTKSSSKTSTKN